MLSLINLPVLHSPLLSSPSSTTVFAVPLAVCENFSALWPTLVIFRLYPSQCWWSGISLWFWITFLKWFMLNMFSWAYWPYLKKFLSLLNSFLLCNDPMSPLSLLFFQSPGNSTLLNLVVNSQSSFPISSQPQWIYISWKYCFHFAIFYLLGGCSVVFFISIFPTSKFWNNQGSYPDHLTSLSTLISVWCSGHAVILWLYDLIW